jgi:DNA-binding MarR family transcriptional regulator/predicted GNAT family acetyltransferase
MEFHKTAGQMALGSRLRRLGDMLMNDAEQLYRLYDVDIDPRWFPVFYMLTTKGSAGITELANAIGQTHPAVSQVVSSMMKKDIVFTKKCTEDARINKVALTEKGRAIAVNLQPQYLDVNSAIDSMPNAIGSKIWAALAEIEHELADKGLYERVADERKKREYHNIKLVSYHPKYQHAFKDLNVSWIEKHWEMEASDYRALDNPIKNIIKHGGYISIAIYQNEPVGTCALLNMGSDSFELAKMAVSDKAKGMGIGYLLGEHMIKKAKEMGANRVYLESNTVLIPAVNLYRKLGFKQTSGHDSPYDRCNIQMEIEF